MNAADRKLLTRYLATVAKMADLPFGLSAADTEARNREVAARLQAVASYAEWVASDQTQMSRRLANAVDMMLETLAKPLPYTPEPPEYADLCECGNPRNGHVGLTGPYVLHIAYPGKYPCREFRLASPGNGQPA